VRPRANGSSDGGLERLKPGPPFSERRAFSHCMEPAYGFRQVIVRRFRPPCRGERLATVKAHRLNRTTRPLLQYLPKPCDAGEIDYFYPSHSQYFAEAAV